MTQVLKFDDSKIPETDFDVMKKISDDRIALCEMKNREYGSSWCKRGGPGAFFTITRKIDRLEVQAKNRNYDVFDVTEDPTSTESLDETLLDAVAYFLLLLEKRQAKRHMIAQFLEELKSASASTQGTTSANTRGTNGLVLINQSPGETLGQHAGEGHLGPRG